MSGSGAGGTEDAADGTEERIKVGVGLLVIKDGKVLMGRRKGSFGAGEWGVVGGHVEYGETLQQAILRELAEEAGVTVKNVRMMCVSDIFTYAPRHYVDVGFTAEWESGEPQILEPEKRDNWEWIDIDKVEQLPGKLFGCITEYIEAYKTGKTYFTVR